MGCVIFFYRRQIESVRDDDLLFAFSSTCISRNRVVLIAHINYACYFWHIIKAGTISSYVATSPWCSPSPSHYSTAASLLRDPPPPPPLRISESGLPWFKFYPAVCRLNITRDLCIETVTHLLLA